MAPRNIIIDSTSGKDELLPEVEPVINPDTPAEKRPPMKIVWRNVIIFIILHSAALYSLVLIPSMKLYTALWCFFVYMFGGLGITAGSHRLWAHRTYKARLPLRILLACMQSTALQNDIFEWCRDHRVHHKYSETEADPHNAKRGFFFSHVGWLLVRKHPDVIAKGRQLDVSDMKADKVIMFQRKYYKTAVFLFCFFLPSVIPNYFWGESLWNGFYLAGILRYVLCLNATWLVNSAAHMWGSKPYDYRINPAENRFVCVCAVGEGFHNYHHTFPQDYSTSEFGWRLNVTTFFIDFMALFGLAYDRKKVSMDMVLQRKLKTGDGSRL